MEIFGRLARRILHPVFWFHLVSTSAHLVLERARGLRASRRRQRSRVRKKVDRRVTIGQGVHTLVLLEKNAAPVLLEQTKAVRRQHLLKKELVGDVGRGHSQRRRPHRLVLFFFPQTGDTFPPWATLPPPGQVPQKIRTVPYFSEIIASHPRFRTFQVLQPVSPKPHGDGAANISPIKYQLLSNDNIVTPASHCSDIRPSCPDSFRPKSLKHKRHLWSKASINQSLWP